MKTILFLFCIFLPAVLFGQTWQQAVDKALAQSAKKASISLQKSKTRLKALNQTLEKEAHMRKVLDSYYAPVTPYSISNVYHTLAVAWAGASNKLNIIHRIKLGLINFILFALKQCTATRYTALNAIEEKCHLITIHNLLNFCLKLVNIAFYYL